MALQEKWQLTVMGTLHEISRAETEASIMATLPRVSTASEIATETALGADEEKSFSSATEQGTKGKIIIVVRLLLLLPPPRQTEGFGVIVELGTTPSSFGGSFS
jgi:hypothetical protein